MKHGNTWALVLAAGEGSRLRSLTNPGNGVPVPKQFCSLLGGPSLLQEALSRAGAVAPAERICAVVAAQHRRWWDHDTLAFRPGLRQMQPGEQPLCALPSHNVIVQPANRGTAIGILLPLLHIAARDPEASVVLLPSDHHVCDEPTLASSLRQAAWQTWTRPGYVLLLGVQPDEADTELGYIASDGDDGAIRTVKQFVEKPSRTLARELIDGGALWNVFILAAAARTLIELIEQRFPQLVMEMRSAVHRDPLLPGDGPATSELYERLPTLDFSRDVLEGQESRLRLLTVPPCGWSDLGTPARVADALRRLPRDVVRTSASPPTQSTVNLAAQHLRLQRAI